MRALSSSRGRQDGLSGRHAHLRSVAPLHAYGRERAVAQKGRGLVTHGPFVTHHLVVSAQLNHHGTLFAGSMAQWLVEASFMCAAELLGSETVFVRLHDMDFALPVHPGETVRFESVPVLAGSSSLTIYTRALVGARRCAEGFLTFVHTDERGRPAAHGVSVNPASEQERKLRLRAEALRGRPSPLTEASPQ